MLPDFSLKGKVAIITGGGHGIGRGIALTFAEAGADVVICSRTPAELEEVAGEIKAMGKRVITVKTDVTVKSEIQSLVDKTVQEFGTVDVLVNNAVAYARGYPALIDLPEDEWDKTVDVGLKGAYMCCSAVARVMIEKKMGSIINMGSTAGIRPTGNQGAYSIIKAGCMKMVELLAAELGPYNIRVNSVAPTNVNTPAIKKALDANQFIKNQFLAQVPLGRITELDEVTAAVLFLAADASSSISGHTIVVDGGRMHTFPRIRTS